MGSRYRENETLSQHLQTRNFRTLGDRPNQRQIYLTATQRLVLIQGLPAALATRLVILKVIHRRVG